MQRQEAAMTGREHRIFTVGMVIGTIAGLGVLALLLYLADARLLIVPA